MSIIIHETDNLTIIAGKGEQLENITPTSATSALKKQTRYTLRLHISILVNGKIKSLFQQYDIIGEKGTIVGDDDIYKLKEYNSFNTLCDLLSQLGYDTMGFYGKLDGAIDKLFKD